MPMILELTEEEARYLTILVGMTNARFDADVGFDDNEEMGMGLYARLRFLGGASVEQMGARGVFDTRYAPPEGWALKKEGLS